MRRAAQFPLTPALRAVLERQRARTLAVEKATLTIIPWLFHRTGRPIKSFRRAWLAACNYRRYAIVDEAMLKEAPQSSVGRAQRARQVRAARAKSLRAGEKTMAGWARD